MSLEYPDEGEIANSEFNYSDLIDQIDKGNIHIPEFQREFVWTKKDILNLLDSIYKGYPVGSLILWVTDDDFSYSEAIADNEDSSLPYTYFVIDGQQRMKSLYYAAKKRELEMKKDQSNKTVTKKIDVLFNLEDEEFLFREDLTSEKSRTALSIPGIKGENIFFGFLEAIENDTIENYREKFDYPEGPIDRFLGSLEKMKLVDNQDDNHELTDLGSRILDEIDRFGAAEILADNVKFIKEALTIISENEGITRSEAKHKFQEVYGQSENTAYHQFGRRCRWFRALGLAIKEDGGYIITDLGTEFLKTLRKKEKERKSRIVPLEKILVDPADMDYQFMEQFPQDRKKQLTDLRKQFHGYKFSTIVVNKSRWGDVVDIFERINTEGQLLTVVDLMIAKTWSAEEFNLRDELKKFKNEVGEPDLPDITILQSLSVNLVGKCRRRDILNLESTKVAQEWSKTTEAMKRSLDFLKSNLNIPGLKLIPYSAQLVPLAKFFYIIENDEPSQEQKGKLIRWFWKSSLSSRFDSAVASKLEEDGKSMEKISKGELPRFEYSFVRRTPEDLIKTKYSLNNAFIKTLMCLYASQEPLNPVNNSPVNFEKLSKYTKSELHHIFPRNYLRTRGHEDDFIDSIVNIMFLPANLNKGERFKKSPKEYLGQIRENNSELGDTLESHLIYNIDESGLMENDFEQFLHYRARQILDKLEEAVGEEKLIESGRELSPETPFTNELHIRELIRKSSIYIYWFDRYFTRKGLGFLAEEVDPDRVDEVKILSGTKQTDHNLRSSFKDFQKELRNKGIDAEMRVLVGDKIREIHDRWLITENKTYNIPSINTIKGKQYAEITISPSQKPFEEWWEEGFDILEDWNEIQKYID